jgi:hypothetical protein
MILSNSFYLDRAKKLKCKRFVENINWQRENFFRAWRRQERIYAIVYHSRKINEICMISQSLGNLYQRRVKELGEIIKGLKLTFDASSYFFVLETTRTKVYR